MEKKVISSKSTHITLPTKSRSKSRKAENVVRGNANRKTRKPHSVLPTSHEENLRAQSTNK